MDLSITSALALFALIALSTVIFFTAKRFKLPYTVLLVFVGLLLIPVVNLPYLKNVFGFLGDMVLTPELLFYIFLPILIFESAFNMNIRKILDSVWVIGLMSVVSLLVSTVLIAMALYLIMPLIGIHMPLAIAFIFGALISPTDPVAALSIFKECGVPRRLANIFEGESLVNDGTAMAIFFVMLSIAMGGFHGSETVLHGLVQFSMMVLLGVGFGLLMAGIFSRALRLTKSNEFVTVTLMLISAHTVFILSEMINEMGFVHISPIIATAVAALFMGNYSRHVLAPRVDEYLTKLIEHMAFVLNSLVFLMAGLLFASADVNLAELWLPILVTVMVVATARVIAVYSVTLPLNMTKLERPIPASWQKLLAWGSLRGALSIIIVMLIPKDFTVPGWTYEHSPQDLLLALTIGCILTTLFIKAPLIKPIMKKLNIRDNNPLEEAHEADLAIYYLLQEKSQLDHYKTKGFLSQEQYDVSAAKVANKLKEAETQRQYLIEKHGIAVFKQSLHLAMVHVEKKAVKRLFINEEVSEKTFRRIYSKLGGRLDKIEELKEDAHLINTYKDRKDIFEHLVNFVQMPFDRQRELSHQQKLEYYRAQMIMARKAIKTIEQMQTEFDHPVFLPEAYDEVISLYRRYKDRSGTKAEDLVALFKDELSPYLENLANRSLAASGTRALAYLHENGLADEHMQESIRERWAV
jgi:CPA1 family monovalent cation:H+ antiporter